MTKYISDNGVRKLNPDWHPSPSAPVSPSLPFENKATSLPVVSYPSQPDFFEEEIVVAPSYQQAVEQYNEIIVEAEIVPEHSNANALDQLSSVLARYEVPAGMLSKLLMLGEYEIAEIIVDDSGSMNLRTDAKGPQGQSLTRWQEAKQRIEEMMELIAHVPSAPAFHIRFLNRPAVLELKQNAGEVPEAFFERVKQMLELEFITIPNGGTPALEAIRASLARYPPGKAVLRYFFGDGVPNGGTAACKQIAQMLVERSDPSNNPFTFISCTNDDAAVEWMKDCEEVAPFCSEFDDYNDESREIVKDQGKAFPYSYGLHLVGQIVAVLNPHDLDAMDESVPFTKATLQDLLGYQILPQEFKYYFDSFMEAQRALRRTGSQQSFTEKLPSLYNDFVNASRSADIPAVTEYRIKMKQEQEAARSTQLARSAQPMEAACCLVM